MSPIKVLAYFNKKKCRFSIKALEGDNTGSVIAHEREIILTDCRFSENKDKTAGVIGIWDPGIDSSRVDKEIRRYFGGEEDEDGWSPAYVSESIKYDVDTKKYIVDDNEAFEDLDPEVRSQMQNDKKPALDNAGLIYLEIDANAFDDANSHRQGASENEPTIYDVFENPPDICDVSDADIITGFACYWRRRK